MRIRATINPESRCTILAKSALLEINAMPSESNRYDKAVEFLQILGKMVEKVSNTSDNDLITRTFHACDKAWIYFAQKCPSVIDGFKPTGSWFRQIIVQIAVVDGEEVTDNLRSNFKNLGWSGLLEDYLYPAPKDPKEQVIEIEVELR